MKNSYIIALFILFMLVAWMHDSKVVTAGKKSSDNQADSIAKRNDESIHKHFKVRYSQIKPDSYSRYITVRGRTKAKAVIAVRTETSGILKHRAVDKGDYIKSGDLLCILDKGTRETRVKQSEADLAEAQLNYDANFNLFQKGFSSEAKLKAALSKLTSAKSSLAIAELELSRTKLYANVSGIVQDPVAEVGTLLAQGNICVTLINIDPIMFIGEISEREIGNIKVGMKASIRLITGQISEGFISYIASSANTETRTFLVEVTIPNSRRKILDGLTATTTIKLDPQQAYEISSAWLTLSESGDIGVKIVNDKNIVEFVSVKILEENRGKFWVTGLIPNSRIITFGQEYVSIGEIVDPVKKTTEKSKTDSGQK